MNNTRRLVVILACLAGAVFLSAGCGFSYATPPVITVQPANFYGNCGDTAVFTVTATGTAPLYYQWLWNNHYIHDGVRFEGANSPVLKIYDLRSNDTGSISVIVKNNAGSTVSHAVLLFVRDTLDYSITWPYGDLDIGVQEPDGQVFYVDEYWESDNGGFSADCTNGGTEWWVMYEYHETGLYNLKIWDWDYTGYVSVTVHHNETMVGPQSGDFFVRAGYEYTFEAITVVRSGGKEALKFTVTEKPIPPDAVKPGPKGPSPRRLG